MRRFVFAGFFLLSLTCFITKPLEASEIKQQPTKRIFSSVAPTSTAATIPSQTEYELSYPGILPDHPLYIFKVLRDHIVLFFIKPSESRVQLLVLLADKRLAMGEALFAKKKEDLAVPTISKGEKYLLRAIEELKVMHARGNAPSVGLVNAVGTSMSKHKEIILRLLANADGETEKSLGLSLQLYQDAEKQLNVFKTETNIAM